MLNISFNGLIKHAIIVDMKYMRRLLVIVLALFLSGVRSRRVRQRTSGRQDGSYVDGSDADSPADLTKRGWKAVLLRTRQALKDKDLSMMAAALGYYTTLSFFPITLGLASLYAALAGPQQLLHLLANLQTAVPPVIQDLLQRQLSPLVHEHGASLGIATLISLAVLLWTASGGIQNLVKATNYAYGVEESRSMIKLRLTSIVLSVAFLFFFAVILVLLVTQGSALHAFGLPNWMDWLFPIVRWPLLVIVISVMLAVIYRYAPNRKAPAWSWVSWGAAAATIIWLIGTGLFFFYAQHFGNFNKSYGTFASIIILMTWFYLSSFIILLGAQVNNKLEEVTEADTTA